MATALASIIKGKPIRHDMAMTGEITLTGQVLPVGGIKEKTLAAKRAGITTSIVPEKNKNDMEEIDTTLQSRHQLHFRQRYIPGFQTRVC